MRKTLSLLLTIAMAVTMAFGSAGSVFAADSTAATTMKIAGTDGTVTITNEKGKDVPANVDTKLLNGYTIKTAAASYCFISLDDSKAIKLGQNTKVKVEKSGKKIELNVKNGEIFFDVDKKLSGNESMNIKTGNMTTGIRGTSGILKTIKQGQSSIDLFQLFSGKTEMKANTQKNVQNIIERILGALGITAQTQTVTANAQVLESTTATAGQQIAITGMAPEASAQTAPTFERQALAVSEFGTRSILESAAIKGGMSAGEALTSDTETIVAQVGDVTQTLENAGVAQAAIDQVAGAAADPAKLDEAVKNAELQAAVDQILTEQGIDTAKDEAAKVDGTTSNAGESKVLDKVEVKTDSGANASGLTLSDDGTSAVATANDRQKTNSGSHSGGSGSVVIPESGYLTGYTGAFNYFDYLKVLNGHQQSNIIFKEDPSVKCSESDIFIFNTIEEYTSFAAILADAKANYEDVKASLAAAGEPEPSYTGLVVNQYLMPTFARNYFNNQGGSPSYVMLASDSGDYPYYAIGHTAPYEEKTGTLHVRITKQELSVRWLCVGENENETLAPASGTVFPSDLNGITDIKPEIGVVDDEGLFVRVDADIVGYDEDGDPLRIPVGPGYDSGFDPVVNSGTIKVNSIEVPYFYAHPDEIIEPIGDPSGDPSGGIPYNPGGDPSGEVISVAEPAYVYETANFCLTGVYEYNYRIEPGWITGYTGTYDGEDHPAFNLTEDQANNYYIFCFDGKSSTERQKYRNIATSWSALRSEVNFDFNDAIAKLRFTTNGGFGWDFYDPAGSHETVCSVSRTGRYLYYAIPKQGNLNDIKTGGTPVVIETADLYIGWGMYNFGAGTYTDVPSGSTLTLNQSGNIDVKPYTYMLGTGGAKVPVSLDGQAGYSFAISTPVENADGLYTVKVTGIEYMNPKMGRATVTPLNEGGSCPANDGNCNVIGSNLTFTYRLAEGQVLPNLTGYTGVYDGRNHDVTTLSALQNEKYWYWIFDDDDKVSEFEEQWETISQSLASIENEAERQEALFNAVDLLCEEDYGDYYCYMGSNESQMPYMEREIGTDRYYYIAINKATGGLFSSSFETSISDNLTGASRYFLTRGYYWQDFRAYDLAFIANEENNTYAKWVNGARTDASVAVADVLSALSTDSAYNTIYLDTGESGLDLCEALEEGTLFSIKAYNKRRAVFVTGAGIKAYDADIPETHQINMSVDGAGQLIVRLGCNEEALTHLNATYLNIGSNVEFNNFGEIAIDGDGGNINIQGEFINSGTIRMCEDATGSINIAGGRFRLNDHFALVKDDRSYSVMMDVETEEYTVITGTARNLFALTNGGRLDLSEGSLYRKIVAGEGQDMVPEVLDSDIITKAVFGKDAITKDTASYYYMQPSNGTETQEVTKWSFNGTGGSVYTWAFDGENTYYGENGIYVLPEYADYADWSLSSAYAALQFICPAGTFESN